MKKQYKIAMALGLSIPVAIILTGLAVFRPHAQANKSFARASQQKSDENLLVKEIALNLPSEFEDCHASWLTKIIKVSTIEEKNTLYGLVISKNPKNTEPKAGSLSVYRAEKGRNCEDIISPPSRSLISDDVPESVAVSLKKEWWEWFSASNPEEFKFLISQESEVAYPFFSEDQKAIGMLGYTLKVRIFDTSEDYERYVIQNDPQIIQDHPGVIKRKKELGIE